MVGVPWGGVMRRTNSIQASHARHIDHFICGHYHQANVVDGGRILMNGSVKGVDEWVLKKFGGGQAPDAAPRPVRRGQEPADGREVPDAHRRHPHLAGGHTVMEDLPHVYASMIRERTDISPAQQVDELYSMGYPQDGCDCAACCYARD